VKVGKLKSVFGNLGLTLQMGRPMSFIPYYALEKGFTFQLTFQRKTTLKSLCGETITQELKLRS
jgi:hypothetical protein